MLAAIRPTLTYRWQGCGISRSDGSRRESEFVLRRRNCQDRGVSRRHWVLFVVLAAVWGAPYLFIKIAIEDLSPAALACTRTAIGAAVLLPLAARAGGLGALRGRLGALASPAASGATIGATAVLGVVCTAGGFLLFATLLRAVGAGRSSTVAYLAPGFSVLFGVAFRGEALTLSMVAGLALILAGSWLAADGRLRLRRGAGAPPPR